MLDRDIHYIDNLPNPDGTNPEMIKRIEDLDFHKFGRAIRRTENHENSLVGYILPMNSDHTRHLLLLASGSVMIIEPYSPNDGISLKHYKDFSTPNESAAITSWGSSLREIFDLFSRSFISDIHAARIASNENPAQKTEIEEAIKEAMSFARDLKEQRAKAKADSLTMLFREIDDLLKPVRPEMPFDLES